MGTTSDDRHNGATRAHRWFERIGIVAAAVLVPLLVVRVANAPPLVHGALLAGAAVMGYIAADLLSGLVHWTFDTWGSARTPVIGQSFIRPFREHHDDPLSITRHDFVATNGNTCIASLPLLALACALPLTSGARLLFTVFLLALTFGLLATNQIHKWAHEEHPGRFVRLLQRCRIILTPEHHHVHHVAPYATHYCITTGWLNSLLAAVNFHRRAERVVAAMSGARPH